MSRQTETYGSLNHVRREGTIYSCALNGREIRLLCILPGKGTDAIECSLSYHSLGRSTVHYLALSYSWGFLDVSHTIKCEGHDVLVSKSVFTALKNLRELPLLEECGRRIWIDAICINQTDPNEKSRQVRMMHDIYRCARKVVAWLGEATQEDREGFDMINLVARTIQADQFYGWHSRHDQDYLIANADRIGLPSASDRRWKYVKAIFEKPWFTRIWVIQECVFAERLAFLCSDVVTDSRPMFFLADYSLDSDFLGTLVQGERSRKALYFNAGALARWKTMTLNGNVPWSMFESLTNVRLFEASDQRDKVFALVSLSEDVSGDIIDYSLSLRSVLVGNMLRLLASEKSPLDRLCYAHLYEHIENVPSWVCCWTKHRHGVIESSKRSNSQFLSGEEATTPSHQPQFEVGDQDALLVTAYTVDSVITISAEEPVPNESKHSSSTEVDYGSETWRQGVLSMLESPYEHMQWLTNLDAATRELGNYPTGHAINEVFWRSWIQDNDHDERFKLLIVGYLANLSDALTPKIRNIFMIARKICGLYSSVVEPSGLWQKRLRTIFLTIPSVFGLFASYKYLKFSTRRSLLALSLCTAGITRVNACATWAGRLIFDWLKKPLANNLSSAVGAYESWMAGQIALEKQFAGSNYGRRYCITEKGYVGWMPNTVAIGDEICVFEGSRLPFVIRKARSAEDTGFEPYKLIGDCYLHGMMKGKSIYESATDKRRIRII